MTTIAFIAPSGRTPHPEWIDRAAVYFNAHGWRVEASDSVWAGHQRFAGEDEERLQAMRHIVQDRRVDVVMAMRGGYGLTRLLDRIQWKSIARSGKIFVGHSDFTAFNLALLSQTGAISFQGPNAGFDFGQETVSAWTAKHFFGLLNAAEYGVTIRAPRQPKVDVSGLLWGGNLAMLVSLLGTPYFPKIRGGILFLEDVAEHPYRIERMLLQLMQAGVLKDQKAVLLGQFTDYRLSEYDNGYDFEQMVKYLRERVSIPILTGLPFGHVADKLTLPVGAPASVQTVRGGYRLCMQSYPRLSHDF